MGIFAFFLVKDQQGFLQRDFSFQTKMETEKFCLRWNDFESNISSAFRDLRDDKDFFDLTLACENDEKVQAHKVILAACSPFFHHVLRHNPHHHPLLYLKGIRHTDLMSVLSFMYHGEVNVAQEELNSFLAVAEELKIKGLTQSNSKEPDIRKEKPPPPLSKPRATAPKDNPTPPTSKPRTPTEDEIQEITTIKSEPKDQPTTPTIQSHTTGVVGQHRAFATEPNQVVAQVEEAEWDTSENYEYDQYNTETYEPGMDHSIGSSQAWNLDHEGVDQQIESLIQKHPEGGYLCTACGHINISKKDLRRHVETHIDTPGYPCNFCGKQFKTRNSLNTHQSTKHREERKQYYIQ